MASSIFELRAISVRRGSTTALDDVTLTVSAGERIAVIGPSGAGKSTLIGLLNGTVPATTGTVTALGCTYGTAPVRRIRATQRRIGTVHQRFDLVDQLRTVHNVNAGLLGSWPFWKAAASLIRPRNVRVAAEALDRVGIADKLHVPTGDLSGGEQQRVAIARVLVQRPQVILADEPVASLDPARSREIVDLLLGLCAETGATLLASLHDVDLALDSFERVIGLRAGRIAFDRRRADLRAAEVDALYAREVPAEAG